MAKVSLNEYEFPINKLANIEEHYMKLITKNYYLNQAAHEGYRSYLHVYLILFVFIILFIFRHMLHIV